MKSTRVLLAIVLAAMCAAPAWAARVTGVVVDAAGRPVELANVRVAAHRAGAVTDAQGAFSLELPEGAVTIEATQIGYTAVRLDLLVATATAPIRIVLREAPVPVSEVVVAASSFGKAGKSEGATLRRLDVFTTPGGAADVFQSLRAMPGINAPNEGAALFVRGGDPSETIVRIDGGEIGHPYHYEGASGGLFSTLDAYMLKSAFFSSGGFSARYGGALSGVMDIETQDPMNLRTVSVGANLVGGGMSTSWALVPDKLSVVGSVRASNVDLLEQLYGASRDYVLPPRSADAAGRLLYRYSPSGRLSFLYLGSGDRASVSSDYLNYSGVYTGESRNQVATLQWQEAIGRSVALRGSAGYQQYQSEWSFGPTQGTERERRLQGTFDAVWAASPRHELSAGVRFVRRADDLVGVYPADSTDLHPGAPVRYHDTRPRLANPGGYVEDKIRLWGPVYATLGVRTDRVSLADTWTVDPRAAVAWRINDRQTVRVAAGRYHQPANPEYLDPVYGNPSLGPLAADHVIAGYEWLAEESNVRIDFYRKRYDDLITQSAETYYANQGHGEARGVDVFARTRSGPYTGWVSYGFLDSRRLEGDAVTEVPSPYGVRHSLTLVGSVQLPGAWQLGGRLGVTSGRPYTPVIGATYDPTRDIHRPIEGEQYSALMPQYHRLDVRVTRLFTMPAALGLPESGMSVLYLETLNVLDTPNVLEYVYNDDYSERREVLSYFSRRMVVAGFALTW
jgi:vitamin B12 transporter